MADVEMINFEAAVDKLCSDWVQDVARMLTDARASVGQRTKLLRQKIVSVRVPQKVDEKKLGEIPARINEILKQDSVRLKGIVELELVVEIDLKARKLKIDGHSMKGHLVGL
jgi:hypothetical protein